jgi:hypothetical protein
MVRYKVELTVSSQTLFGIIAKLLPPEDHLHIEEINEAPQVKQPSTIARLITENKAISHIKEPKKKQKIHSPFKHPSGKGSKEFLIEYMTRNSTANWNAMGAHIEALGYSKSSVNNAISRLVESKMIEKVSVGVYRLIKNPHEK